MRSSKQALSLKEVLIVESQIVSLSPDQLLSGSPKEQGSPADDRGRQSTVTPTGTTSTSVLKSIIG